MRAGDLVAGRFRIGHEAARGAAGAVFRATDTSNGGAVAVKVLHTASESQVERFRREVELLDDIRHPAIVEHVAHGLVDSATPFLAMEWLEGETLAERLKRSRLGVGQAIALTLRVAEALGTAHRRGGVHRDVKPGNVFLVGAQTGRPKVIDFGLALMPKRRKVTTTGAVLGSIGYMAPEQVRGEREVDARADVFALGCVLFKCLTGRAPFAGDSAISVLRNTVEGEPPSLDVFVSDASRALTELVARMLAKDAGRRPPDGFAVAEQLARMPAR